DLPTRPGLPAKSAGYKEGANHESASGPASRARGAGSRVATAASHLRRAPAAHPAPSAPRLRLRAAALAGWTAPAWRPAAERFHRLAYRAPRRRLRAFQVHGIPGRL